MTGVVPNLLLRREGDWGNNQQTGNRACETFKKDKKK